MGEGVDFREYLDAQMDLREPDPHTYSPLVLAYLGDAAYELIIRTILVEQCNCPVNKLNRRASALAKASAQSDMIEKLLPLLTQEETQVYKRGRNAKSATKAKNADVLDYRRATGFEALMGYLYLKKDMVRMIDLIRAALADMPKDGDPHNRRSREAGAKTRSKDEIRRTDD